ncbi:site-2 protease family protein [Treponema sp. R6D11]
MLFLMMLGDMDWVTGALWLVVLLLSITMHEVAHGLVALWCGDDTAKLSGRLTLDPRAHLSWHGLIALLLLPIGWAIPVPVNSSKFKKFKLGLFLVSIAGIATNLLLSLLSCLGLAAIARFTGVWSFEELSVWARAGSEILASLAIINLGLALFNLIPFPPLDGSKLLYLLFPKKAFEFFSKIERYGMLPLFLLVFLFQDQFSWLINTVFGGFIGFASLVVGAF